LLGDDFRWKKPELQYVSWERLIRDVHRAHGRAVRIAFSTPSKYFEQVGRTANNAW